MRLPFWNENAIANGHKVDDDKIVATTSKVAPRIEMDDAGGCIQAAYASTISALVPTCVSRVKAAIHVGRERRFLDNEQNCESRSSWRNR